MCTETEAVYYLCGHAERRTSHTCPYAKEIQFQHLHHEHHMREMSDCPYYMLEGVGRDNLCRRCKREVYGRHTGSYRKRSVRQKQEEGCECLCVVQ